MKKQRQIDECKLRSRNKTKLYSTEEKTEYKELEKRKRDVKAEIMSKNRNEFIGKLKQNKREKSRAWKT